MAIFDQTPPLLQTIGFPGGKLIIPIELRGFAPEAVVKAVVYSGTGDDVNKLSDDLQPQLTKIDGENWTAVWAGAKTKDYKQPAYVLDILVDEEVVSSGPIKFSRATRTTSASTGEQITLDLGGAKKIVLTPFGKADSTVFFDFSTVPAINNQQLRHNLNCDDIEVFAFAAAKVRLFDVQAIPYQNQAGINPRNVAYLFLPNVIDPDSKLDHLYIKALYK
ncbi:hypothetical protein [Spirosoma utsteinense]|uniref:hypothetical protein n=1 Tax=Spirosoma utsteinense TaxID=2585773 RepID=UPI0016488D3D|nr:hypothetical protein [Spirosoma utsteinense]MBC3785718.1 hypothetical protein [Spirosoma utsteinense]